jgi:hypothetical protein
MFVVIALTYFIWSGVLDPICLLIKMDKDQLPRTVASDHQLAVQI